MHHVKSEAKFPISTALVAFEICEEQTKMVLSVGDVAPPFSCVSHNCESHTLSSLLRGGKEDVLLWFYPRASTPG